MQTLRHMTCLARLVLASFLLSLGVAAASPAVTPRPLELVCSGGVYKLVTPETGAQGAGSLECPLCVASSLPPGPPMRVAGADGFRATPPAWVPGSPHALRAVLPPPARAPPSPSA